MRLPTSDAPPAVLIVVFLGMVGSLVGTATYIYDLVYTAILVAAMPVVWTRWTRLRTWPRVLVFLVAGIGIAGFVPGGAYIGGYVLVGVMSALGLVIGLAILGVGGLIFSQFESTGRSGAVGASRARWDGEFRNFVGTDKVSRVFGGRATHIGDDEISYSGDHPYAVGGRRIHYDSEGRPTHVGRERVDFDDATNQIRRIGGRDVT